MNNVPSNLDELALRRLLEIIALINSETEIPRLLKRVLESAGEIVGADAASILLLNTSGKNLRFEMSIGSGSADVRKFTVPLEKSAAGWVVQNGKTLVINDLSRDPRFYRKVSSDLDESHHAMVAVPLFVKKRCVGVMEALHFDLNKAFSPADVALLEAFAGQAAIVIDRARLCERLSEQNRSLRSALSARYTFENIVTRDAAMLKLIEAARTVAVSPSTVLITGETGTGKEVLAQAIHSGSARYEGPFIAINCGAIPENLLEAELFGYEKGAFTGAQNRKLGRIELADEGSIFLDEIGEMPMLLQVKLLRLLQEKTFERLGGMEPISVDVRIIAATNRDLAKEVRERRFREDLYYRLNVVPIRIPPLRDRRDDIPLLAEHFLRSLSKGNGRAAREFSPGFLDRLSSHDWPGNIRELQNVIERSVVLSTGDTIDSAEFASRTIPPSREFEEPLVSFRDAQVQFKRSYLQRALKEAGGNQAAAARMLDIQRTYLSRLLKELDLRDSF